jgi:uncharacterized protein (DUF433 family)
VTEQAARNPYLRREIQATGAARASIWDMRQLERITIDPRVCLGQPTIRGMRITVSLILKTLAAGRSVTEVLAAYPELEEQDVRQAMQYAAWLASDQLHLVESA